MPSNNPIRKAWLDGCETSSVPDMDDTQLRSCVSIAGNFRVSAVTTLFFMIASMATFCQPTANREAWPIKIILYLSLVAATIVIPNEPYFTPIYFAIAIVGGVIFICLQQFVILDCSYNWNDSWVEKSNVAEREEIGSGRKWLYSILTFCAIFFLGAIGALVYMFTKFTGCATNNAFISITLIFCILLPMAQLTGNEGNLLSVTCISAWAVFLCYTAVIKNPDTTCNPKAGDASPVSIAYGLILTLISLSWAGWSYTAEDKLTDTKTSTNEEDAAPENIDDVAESGTRTKRDVTGVVVTQTASDSTAADDNCIVVDKTSTIENEVHTKPTETTKSSNAWKLNVALAVVSCWCAMTLTQWGVVEANDGTIAHRNVGHISMWVIIGSQWFVMTLYLWTLIAPRLFPNRDFS